MVRVVSRTDLPEPEVPDGGHVVRPGEHGPLAGRDCTAAERDHLRAARTRTASRGATTTRTCRRSALFPPVARREPEEPGVSSSSTSPTPLAGTLPAFSLVDPDFVNDGSEENNADVRVGEEFAARVVRAAMNGPAWAEDDAHLDLRRRWRLLRPRSRHHAPCRPDDHSTADHDASRRNGRLRSAGVPRSCP